MSVTRCENCNGKKTIIGLGCFVKDCPGCNGVGYVKIDDVPKRTSKKTRSVEKCQSKDMSLSEDPLNTPLS